MRLYMLVLSISQDDWSSLCTCTWLPLNYRHFLRARAHSHLQLYCLKEQEKNVRIQNNHPNPLFFFPFSTQNGK